MQRQAMLQHKHHKLQVHNAYFNLLCLKSRPGLYITKVTQTDKVKAWLTSIAVTRTFGNLPPGLSASLDREVAEHNIYVSSRYNKGSSILTGTALLQEIVLLPNMKAIEKAYQIFILEDFNSNLTIRSENSKLQCPTWWAVTQYWPLLSLTSSPKVDSRNIENYENTRRTE